MNNATFGLCQQRGFIESVIHRANFWEIERIFIEPVVVVTISLFASSKIALCVKHPVNILMVTYY